MAETWLKEEQFPDVVDLKTVAQSGNVIEVRDVTDDGKTALKCANTDGVDAKAFEALGKSVMEAVSANNPASTALEVTNASTNAGARALVVEGKTDLIGAVQIPDLADAAVTALKVKNLDGVSSKALEAEGQSVIKANVVAGSDSTSLIVTNLSYRTGSKAMDVNGRVDIEAAYDDPETVDTYGLKVTNHSLLPGSRALDVTGMTMLTGKSTDNPASIALKITNESTNTGARALVIEEGIVEVKDKLTVTKAVNAPAVEITNTNGNENARALKATGTTELVGALALTVLGHTVLSADNDSGAPTLTLTNPSPSVFARSLKIAIGSSDVDSHSLWVVNGKSKFGGKVIVDQELNDAVFINHR